MHAGWQPTRLLDRRQKGKEQSLRVKKYPVALNMQTLSRHNGAEPSSKSVLASGIGASSTAAGSARPPLVLTQENGNVPSQPRHSHAQI